MVLMVVISYGIDGGGYKHIVQSIVRFKIGIIIKCIKSN